jgi:membrane protein
VQKVEESFNYVWYVGTPRSFARRFTEYTIVLLIGPVVIAIALGMIASLRSNTVVQFFLRQEFLGPVFVATSKLTPYLLVTGVFTFVYKYIPNTVVRFRSALIGGIAGGFIWATLSAFFATFVAYATARQAIYAGFAVAITALIWLYLNWLVLLVGAQLAFYLQNPAFLRIGRQEPRLSNAMRERLVLNIMFLVGRAFRKGQPFQTTNQLAETLRIPSIAVSPIIASLEADGLLTTGEKEELLPAREISRVRLTDILAVVRERGETGSHRNPAWTPEITALGKQLDEALGAAVADRTLSDLLDETDAG